MLKKWILILTQKQKLKRERLINKVNDSVDVFFKESPEEIKKEEKWKKY